MRTGGRHRTARIILFVSCLLGVGVACVGVDPGDVYGLRQAPLGLLPLTTSGWPSIDAGDASFLYLVDGTRRNHLIGDPIEVDIAQTAWRLEYRTEDGRTMTLWVEPGPDGSIRIAAELDDMSPYEKYGVRLAVGESEGFSGLMERVVGGSQAFSWRPGIDAGLNLRGQTVEMYTLPTVSVYAPFFLSTAGWGVFVDSDWPGTYRFGVMPDGRSVPTAVSIEQEGPRLELLVLPGPEPADVVRRYARITGMPLVPPDYLFGMGRWRDVCWDLPTFYDETAYDGPYNSMVVEDVLMMDALGIPCSWIVIDRPWSNGTFGYGDMTFDDARFPRFGDMVSWLASRDIRTLLWLGPWVLDGQREHAVASGYDVTLTFPYLPEAVLLDFTNPEALAWWSDELLPLFNVGIAGFKLDRGEEKPADGQILQGEYWDGTSYREGHNAYPLWFATAASEAARRAGVSDFVSIYRAGWPGMSSVSTAWGGDTDPSPWGLRSAVIALQRAALLNTPVWGSDTGGYNARPPREVLARWLAFSAFCPIMEVGPMANLAPWAWLPDASGGEIGEAGVPEDAYYDAELLAIWALYAEIHDHLRPTLESLAQRAHEDGTPIVQPLFLAFSEHPEWIGAWEQYLLGPDLLVRPVWESGVDAVDVLIPEGTWVRCWSGDVYAGPTTATVPVPWHVIPLFVRYAGSLDLGDLHARWQNAQTRTRTPPDVSNWRIELGN